MFGDLGWAVESSLYISLAAYCALAGAALMVKDGPVWRSWQMSLLASIFGTVGAVMVVRGFNEGSTPMMLWGTVGVALGRVSGALTNMLLAVHLRRLVMTQPGTKVSSSGDHRRARERRKRGGQDVR